MGKSKIFIPEHYSLLSVLFSYPEPENLMTKVPVIKQIVEEKYPECSGNINEFFDFLNTHTPDEQCEYYIRTFDVQALCYLDLGYVLFGEDYKRGEFLVNLRNEHIKAGNDCGYELADHLPNILNLLPKIKDKAFAEELAYSIMIPALKEILKNFSDNVNVYKRMIELVLYMMESDFKNSGYKQFQITGNEKINLLESIDCTGCKKNY